MDGADRNKNGGKSLLGWLVGWIGWCGWVGVVQLFLGPPTNRYHTVGLSVVRSAATTLAAWARPIEWRHSTIISCVH